MKTNFAMYLPVEGEVNVGDSYLYKDTGQVLICESLLEADRLNGHSLIKREGQKVQLFVCSRDIQFGDKNVYYKGVCSDSELYIKLPEAINIPTLEQIRAAFLEDVNAALKIISEIPPELNWVEEGYEFDENDLVVYFATELIEYYSSPESLLKKFAENRSPWQQLIDSHTTVIDNLILKDTELPLTVFLEKIKQGTFTQFFGMSWS
jgi:hypothetical protein